MDFATIIGLLIAVGAIGGAFMLEGGNIESVFLFGPILVVVGGTLGATTITTSFQTVLQIPQYLRLAFLGKSHSSVNTIEGIVALSEVARRKGVLALDELIQKMADSFQRKAMQLVVDGTEATIVREVLETEIAYIEERHKHGIVFFQKAGGFAPTMGILGTVLGLIQAMSNTGDAAVMASAIAAAFIATLWGVGLANLFLLPISDKLRLRHEEEIAHLELMMEGSLALLAGETPRGIRRRLLSFVAPEKRQRED